MGELSNRYSTGSNGSDPAWIDTAALSARFDAGAVQPYASLVFGLDDDARDVMDEAITVGVEGRLR
jgi:hypothetical protein